MRLEFVVLLLIDVVVLCAIVANFYFLKKRDRKKGQKEDELIEAQKDFFKSRCLELLPSLKKQRAYFRIWRSYDHLDIQREEAHDTNYIWDGLNGVIVVENDYVVSGSTIVGKLAPEVFLGQLKPKGLKHFVEALERVNTLSAA